MKKVLVTGGHVTPALSVMAELKNRGWEIVYVGRKHGLEGDKAISQEKIAVEEAGFRFLELTAGRLQRIFTLYTIPSLIKIPIGFLQSLLCLLNERPQIILSFGGYVALPVVINSWLLGIPIVTHEQTTSVGLANKIIGKLAAKICVSWKESFRDFPQDKVIYTGNPLRQEIFVIIQKLNIKLSKPLLYITGGNLGAHSINVVVEEALPELLKYFAIIHQCGNSRVYNDIEKLEEKRQTLPKELADRYYPVEFISSDYIGWVLNKSEILLSRAGANTVSEIIALKKPALFIPLPWAGENEQEGNARRLVDIGGGRLLPQAKMTAQSLVRELLILYKEREPVSQNLTKLSTQFETSGDKNVAAVITSV